MCTLVKVYSTFYFKMMDTTDTVEPINKIIVRIAKVKLWAIDNTMRQRILAMINEHGRLRAADIHILLKIGKSEASKHIATLLHTNILVSIKDGRKIYYSLNVHSIATIARFVDTMIETGTGNQ